MSDPSFLTFDVGGIQYNIKRDVLLRFPDSFFESMLKPGWKESSESIIRIQRDGELFKFVYDYMFYGKLPRNEIGMPLLIGDDASLLKVVLEEAKFYHLPGLVAECEEWLCTCEVEQRIRHYAYVMDTIDTALSNNSGCYVAFKPTRPTGRWLLTLLRSKLYAQVWVRGTLDAECNPNIFMSTTVQNVNVKELLAAALPSPFGLGSKTAPDKNVCESMEIPASKLRDLSTIVNNIDISSVAPIIELTLKPYKLVVSQAGGHFEGRRDAVRDEHHIGTLVLILASECTGGEIEIYHGVQKTEVAGALNWVAMYGDCVHTIRPVTSGARVLLVFDIWNEPAGGASARRKKANLRDDLSEEDVKEDYYYRHKFWPDDEVNTEFWRTSNIPTSASNPTPAVGIDNIWSRIYGTALDHELEQHSTVCICLEHLYPSCQAINPSFLKGEDANLYQLLKDKYSLGVTSITIKRSVRTYVDDDYEYFRCNEFGSGNLLDDANENENDSVLLVPNVLHRNSVLYYSREVFLRKGHRPKLMVYLAAALIVRKR